MDEIGLIQPMRRQMVGDAIEFSLSVHDATQIRGKRGLNFSEEELCQLCKSWLSVSDDPREVGAKSEQFWVKVALDFAAKFNGVVERTARSLETKWSLVQHSVYKFTRAWDSIDVSDESNVSDESRTEKASLLYRQTSKDGQSFKLLNCWKILSNEPKWLNYNNSRFVKRDTELHLLEGMPSLPAPTPERVTKPPVSNKKQRTAELKVEETGLPRFAAYSQPTVAMAKAAAQKSQAMEDAANLALFTTPLETLDAEGVEYVRLRRASVLRKLRMKAAQEGRANACAIATVSLLGD